AAALLLASATPALAATGGTATGRAVSNGAGAASPGEKIAASLRKSPLYVDPSMAGAFPASVRSSLLAAITKAPAPVFIIVAPLVSGGDWSSGDQLASVVHNDLGKPGIYLTPDAEYGGNIDAYTWPSDPTGTDAPPYHAADAAQAVNLATNAQNTTLPDKFTRCLRLVTDGKAVSAYNAAAKALNSGPNAGGGPGRPSASGSGPSGLVITLIVVIVVLAGGGITGLLFARRRGGRRPSPFITPHGVFAAARAATEAELRTLAREQVIELGELVERPADGALTDAAAEQVGKALDAYEAAGKVLDAAAGIPDLAGVLVLTHLGQGAMAAARAAREGRPAPAASPLCFFNPLHGPAAREIHWRPLGERRSLDVRACAECAEAAGRHQPPDVLTDQDIPYYEADPARSVWAATGYGQLATDLVQRILTRGAHPAG
ncbi:MAG: hypothetical protein J2P25_13720, partial [Nocardiopsaceae bacterium]|nr:hypothetical protein [Nocardiopsaceae bacterium]